MNKLTRTKVAIVVLALGLGTAHYAFAQSDDYNQIVAKAQADLNAGNATLALSESQKAIGMARTRWEAYVIAGGALQLQHHYDKAIIEFSNALKCAPQEKRTAVQGLLEKAVADQASNSAAPNASSTASTSASPSPSYSDTVAWISANLAKGGLPQDNATVTDNNHTENKQEKYSVTINSCIAFTINYSFQDQDSQWVSDTGRVSFPASTNAITATYTFDMNHVGFATQSGNLQDNLYIIASDGIGHYHFYNGAEDLVGDLTYSAGDTSKLANVGLSPWLTASGGVAVSKIVPFKMPGTEDLPSRMVAAFQHLQQICKEHPEQAPKQPF